MDVSFNTYLQYKYSSRIFRILVKKQYCNESGTFIVSSNNRENFLEIIHDLSIFSLFSKEELDFLKSHSNLIPFNRLKNQYNNNQNYVLFHALRITDILFWYETPMNELGYDSCTCMSGYTGGKWDIISSLHEIGIIPWEVTTYFMKNL
jgi:hypothetical protein